MHVKTVEESRKYARESMQRLRHPELIVNSDNVCDRCGSKETLVSKRGKHVWYKSPQNPDKVICHSCHSKDAVKHAVNVLLSNPEHKKKLSDAAKKKWQNPEYRLKKIDSLKKNLNISVLSNAGKNSRIFENKIADGIKNDYDAMFLPQEVCDRIAFKDGKIYFIEIKHKGEKLKPKQLQFSQLVDSYKVVAD